MNAVLIAVAVFIFGTVVGSFLNVVILRQSLGGKRHRRSICLSCGVEIENRDLFPVVSFFMLKGRCRNCKSRISLQYPVVEVLTGLFFVLAYQHSRLYEPLALALADGLTLAAIGAVLAVIFVYDLRHKIIPDWSAVALAFLALLRVSIMFGLSGELLSLAFLWQVLAGAFAAAPFFFLWLFSGGKWMGLGDAKLMIGLGILLGYRLWLPAIAISFWLAAIVVLGLMAVARLLPRGSAFKKLAALDRKSEVPLGPFLIAGSLLTFWFTANINSVFFFLMM
ncbi:MAG: prepilin peptidase [Candidatus Taylorbacteria bacterium]|nr:prepilin peptidase [Candidatus Taylorbacteria bacterium]